MKTLKCTCETCRGRGVIECEDCDGEGSLPVDLLTDRLLPTGDPETRREYQAAARLVAKQAEELSQIFPQNRFRYEKEMREVVDALTKEFVEKAKQAA